MNTIIKRLSSITFLVACLLIVSCHDKLEEPIGNTPFASATDYTVSSDMVNPLIGGYAEFYTRGWEGIPLISVRGDDVNAGGLGDQQDFAEADKFNYNKDYWMFNSLWEVFYRDIYFLYATMDEIDQFRENGANAALAAQYRAEAQTMQAFLLFQISRVWGGLLIPDSPDPADLLVADVASKEETMQWISDKMDEAIPNLPAVHPSERTDIPGGVTQYTALAVKALANLELKNYQAVADACGQIISSGAFQLEPDYYELFKVEKGKLNRENLLELQYSDFGQPSGTAYNYLMAFFGPQDWTPAVEGAGGGWGFYEPSLKYIKFMLDRGEEVRLETSVIFTNRGIDEIKKDPNYQNLPAFVSNTTRDGDTFNDYPRALFASGKHYLPSNQLTAGRTAYGSNKNFICIRYAEILLMYAEALTQGANGNAMSADDAVNAIRDRAGLSPLSGVNLQQVMDEKFAELAMEWGTRYYDLLRLGWYDELSYDGRSFSEDKSFLPYPQNQVDQLPQLDVN